MRASSHAVLNFSCLTFADETYLLYRANLTHLCSFRAICSCFDAAFRLKVNLAKLELVLMDNVPNVDNLASILG